MPSTYVSESSWLHKVLGVVILAWIYWLSSSMVVAWIYEPHRSKLSLLGAPAELALAATSIATFTWIRPIFFSRRQRWPVTAMTVGIQTLALLELYAVLSNWSGPDSPIVTILGSSAGDFFREDAWTAFPLICVPILAGISGVYCVATLWIIVRLKGHEPTRKL